MIGAIPAHLDGFGRGSFALDDDGRGIFRPHRARPMFAPEDQPAYLTFDSTYGVTALVIVERVERDADDDPYLVLGPPGDEHYGRREGVPYVCPRCSLLRQGGPPPGFIPCPRCDTPMTLVYPGAVPVEGGELRRAEAPRRAPWHLRARNALLGGLLALLDRRQR